LGGGDGGGWIHMQIDDCLDGDREYIWSYLVLRIYTNESERIVAVADYRFPWSHG